MPMHRRNRLRRTRPTLELELDHDVWWLWLPEPDHPLTLHDFGDASALAWACLDLAAEREVLALLDDRRTVTALLLDPPADVGVGIGWCEVPGLDVEFSQSLDIVLVDHVAAAPPDTAAVDAYIGLRRWHALQGIRLLDVIRVDGERVQSVAIGAGLVHDWFEPPLVTTDVVAVDPAA